MGGVSKVIRIFISSPFQKGYQQVRDSLVSDVFPQIRNLCLENGLTFQAVDLRWGVSDVESASHLTMKICLDEIRRCKEQSPDFNFLALAGGHYGTSFAPSSIPAEDWNLIVQEGNLTPEELCFLKDCYLRDFNAEGGPYILREFPKEERRSRESRICGTLFPAARHVFQYGDRVILYGASATEQEIQEGLFRLKHGEKQAITAIRRQTKQYAGQIISDASRDCLERDLDLCHRLYTYPKVEKRLLNTIG